MQHGRTHRQRALDPAGRALRRRRGGRGGARRARRPAVRPRGRVRRPARTSRRPRRRSRASTRRSPRPSWSAAAPRGVIGEMREVEEGTAGLGLGRGARRRRGDAVPRRGRAARRRRGRAERAAGPDAARPARCCSPTRSRSRPTPCCASSRPPRRCCRCSAGSPRPARPEAETPLLLGDEVLTSGAVGVRFDGVEILPCVSQGAAPIGPELTITACEGPIIGELAGRPALEKLRETIEALTVDDLRLVQGGLLMGIVVDVNKPEYVQGDFLVRGLVGADPDTGQVAVGTDVRPGQVVRLHARDAASADRDLREALSARMEALGGRAPGGRAADLLQRARRRDVRPRPPRRARRSTTSSAARRPRASSPPARSARSAASTSCTASRRRSRSSREPRRAQRAAHGRDRRHRRAPTARALAARGATVIVTRPAGRGARGARRGDRRARDPGRPLRARRAGAAGRRRRRRGRARRQRGAVAGGRDHVALARPRSTRVLAVNLRAP